MATKTSGSASAQTEALGQLAAFPLVEALFGRRSRRFALGGEIPDGPWPTGPGTSRCPWMSWSGCWC
jgi:hypothetical protein